jgi:hypothetical protein
LTNVMCWPPIATKPWINDNICVVAILYVTFYKIYSLIGSDVLSRSIPMHLFMTLKDKAVLSLPPH